MKRICVCLLVVLLSILLASSASFAANGTDKAALYKLYADGMLFRQNAPAVFAGTASGAAAVQCELLDASGKVVAKAQGPVNKSNRFSVSFPAPKGSYAEYTVQLYADGTPFATLHNVVFGELWLASGQSNMDYPLGQSDTGKQMQESGATASRWLRFYRAPTYPHYKGSQDLYPVDAQRDIEGGLWYDGTSSQIYSTSAVAFFFAQKMQRSLDMPFGVLQSSLGGSSIYSWLSRASIEEDETVRADLIGRDAYFSEENWSESDHDPYLDMTVNYNKKIAPLGVFRPAGMIWYQGETEVFYSASPAMYTRAFDCMQRNYSHLFGFAESERMPFVYTQLVSYNYGETRLQQMNDGYARMQALYPDVRAVTSVYDVPMTYTTEIGYIHPMTKQPIGERMAYAAEGLVYGKHTDTYTAAYPAKTETRDGSVYVTLAHTGAGLVCQGSRLEGFAVCGQDGIYVAADAQIVGKDTVRVSAPEVPVPTAVSYAFSQTNNTANLYASDDADPTMPVSPFITDADGLRQAWQGRDWTSCDHAQTWRAINNESTGFFDTWQAKHAALSYTEDAVCGSALHVQSDAARFTVQPTMLYTAKGTTRRIPDGDNDYRFVSTVTFSVRNTGKADARLDAVRFYTSSSIWFAPAVNGTDDPDCVLPADGQWHTVSLDLNSLYLFGNECGATFSRAKLDNVWDLRLCFSGKDASVDLDEFRFTPDGTDGRGVRFISRFRAADNVWEAICALVMHLCKPLDRLLSGFRNP